MQLQIGKNSLQFALFSKTNKKTKQINSYKSVSLSAYQFSLHCTWVAAMKDIQKVWIVKATECSIKF